MKLIFLLLLIASATVFAEDSDQKNQVYTDRSKLTVDNINNVVEFLRNPTLMSGNFREAIKNITPKNSPISVFDSDDEEDGLDGLPFVELVAKVLADGKPSTVVLRVNDHTMYLSEGSTASQLVNKIIVNIRVDKITKNFVSLYIMPFDQRMLLQ